MPQSICPMKPQTVQLINSMINKAYIILFLALGLGYGFSQSNTPKDSLQTQKVSVVKPYTPTLSEAFRLKTWPEKPHFKGSKKDVKYTIFSAPMASTFVPAKSKSVGLPKAKSLITFDNIARLSLGNYTNISGDLFLNYALSKRQQFHAQFSHNSSQGGIKQVLLDDTFSTNSATLSYQSFMKDSNLNLETAFRRQVTNWYGISEDLPADAVLDSDVKQSLSIFEIFGAYALSDSWLDELNIKAHILSDRFDSQEFNFNTSINFKFNVFNIPLSTKVGLNLLDGTFVKGYSSPHPLEYNNTILSFFPSYSLNHGSLNLSAGFRAYYLSDSVASNQQFYIIPNIKATYNIVDAIFIAYAGVQGDLSANTYLNLYEQNPFISPALEIKPTSVPFKIFLGTKGKLSNQWSYDVKGQFSKHDNSILFKKHSQPGSFDGPVYSYGNSFGLVYDILNMLTWSAEVEGYISEKFQFSGLMRYNAFDVQTEANAWNLPNLEAEVRFDWSFSPKWTLGLQAFYIGKRYDYQSFNSSSGVTTSNIEVTLKAVADLNLAFDYTINDRWLTQLRFNNVLGQNYQRWLQYPTQGVQVSAGAYYKFDF